MANISVNYMGLRLKNPVVVGSSGLTNSLDDIKKLTAAGAGGVVLKSIFEEQIRFETQKFLNDKENPAIKPMLAGYEDMMLKRPYDYAEALEYISSYAQEQTLAKYLKFLTAAKREVDIPIIASINCNSAYEWHYFARRIEEAGADAIELNIYVLPSDADKSSDEMERTYYDIIEAVKKQVRIPVSIKVGYYFSAMQKTLLDLSKTGIKGMVIFNRPFSPDIDINKFEITSSNIFSGATDYSQTLRWVALLSGSAQCDIAASSGIHYPETLIKMLLAGANCVEISSVLYKNGFGVIEKMNTELSRWMDQNGFRNVEDFRGKMSQANVKEKAAFERVQFMRLYSEIV